MAGSYLWTLSVVVGHTPFPHGLLTSPSSGSLSPPPEKRGWHADVAGPPAAADTFLGRTCRHFVPGALGLEEEGMTQSQSAPTPTFTGMVLCLAYSVLPSFSALSPEPLDN
jgi:hypothetical protein